MGVALICEFNCIVVSFVARCAVYVCDFTWPLNVTSDASPAASGGCSLCHIDCAEMGGAWIHLCDVTGFSAICCDVGVNYL